MDTSIRLSLKVEEIVGTGSSENATPPKAPDIISASYRVADAYAAALDRTPKGPARDRLKAGLAAALGRAIEYRDLLRGP